MTDDAKIAETFNSFFGNIVNTLNIEKMRASFVIREMKLIRYCMQNMQVSSQLTKKNNRHEKENYRPVSIISVIFKMLEHCLYDQIYKTIDNTRPRHQMGYRKGYSSQHSLIAMFEKWKKNLDKGGECGVLFVKVRI